MSVAKPMAAFAVVADPLTSGLNNLLVFWNNTNNNINLVKRDINTEAKDVYTNIPSTPQGTVGNPSSLTAFRWGNLVQLFGSDSTGNIIRMSPTPHYVSAEAIVNIDAATPVSTGLAGTSDGDKAWLYFFKRGSTTIVEYDIAAKLSTGLGFKPDPLSYLSATFNRDTNQRWLFFQLDQDDNDGKVQAVNLNTNEKYIIPGSENSKSQTPIAAVYANKRFYVYCVNAKGRILRSFSTIDSKNKHYFSNVSTMESLQLGSFSQLAVSAGDSFNSLVFGGKPDSAGKFSVSDYKDVHEADNTKGEVDA